MPKAGDKKTTPPSSKKSASKSVSRTTKTAKSAGKKKSSKVLEELLALLPELDEEGLAFLLEQARVHRYNMEVERLNAIAERVATGEERSPVAERSALRLERSKDGSTYHIVCGSVWKMFTAEEIAALVRIARSDETENERARRLRSWCARERRDVLIDFGMDGPSIGLALDIVQLLRKSFPPRG
jgi:hypothetical protein